MARVFPTSQRSTLVPVVYTMGKVASSSISSAIQAAGMPCHDIHTLNPVVLRRTTRDWLERESFPPPHICVSMAFRDRLLVKRQRCLYISLVRDPLARNLSAYFQNLHLADAEIRDETRARELFTHFLATYPHDHPLTWFDREYGDQLGIDVYETPFDPATGFLHVPRHNLVLFRVDCPDAIKSRVLSRLLHRRIEVGRENDGGAKSYRERYDAVKSLAVFPASFTERVYGSQFARHFWTEAELTAFRARWTMSA